MANTIVSSLSLSLLLLCTLTIPSADAHGLSYIQKACARAVRFNHQINYDFCLTSLQAVPESYTSEIAGLLEITTHLALQNVTSTSSLISKLLTVSCGDLIKGRFTTCFEAYGQAQASLGVYAKGCALKQYYEVTTLDSSYQGALKCEEALNNSGGVLTEENNNVLQLVSIAKAFAHFVTRHKI